MNCCPYDLRDYLFDELTPSQHDEVRAHVKTCIICGASLDVLRSTQAALLSVRDEEIPQRIGFVSDKVFEPSPLRRWVSGFWNSAARLGFVSASLLSAALLVHTLRPAQIVHNSAQSTLTQTEIDRRINQAVASQVNAQLQSKIDAAVTQAVADTEQRAQKRTTALLAAAEKRNDMERWSQVVVSEHSRYTDMMKNAAMLRANDGSPAQ